ncbi:MAG TPA: hypothetical protein VF235_09195, partial [Actinomycetota bacterium]
MSSRRFLLVATVVVLAVAMATPASAGTPGTWTKIGNDVDSSLPLPTVVRTGNGVLHIVYDKPVATNEQYFHVPVTQGGAVGVTDPVLPSAWDAVHHEAKLVRNGSGLRLLFSGLNGGGTGFFYHATSANGSTWTSPGQVSNWVSAYATYGLGADTFADGTPIVAGALNSDAVWHVGTNAATANGTFNLAVATFIRTNVAVDRESDEAWLVWYDLNRGGVWARRVEPTLGSAVKGPSSTDGGSSLIPGQQVPAVAVPGGGVYTAYCTKYPSCTQARLWEVGTNRTVPVNVSDGTDLIALGVGKGGRIWLVTHDNYTGLFYAARSNPAVTKFGAVQKIKPPKQSADAYGLVVEGSSGRGDIVANVLNSSTFAYHIWHTQVLPGLTLTANDTKWDGDGTKTVTFTVKDAGQAVAGARVKVGTRDCKTGSAGTCRISFPRLSPGKL